MDSFVIQGGCRLEGPVFAGAAKNAALPLLAACVLADGPCRLHNLPELSDIHNMLDILQALGCGVACEGRDVVVDPTTLSGHDMPARQSRLIRSSIFMLGPLLARQGFANFTYPGGCEIGNRPIDMHLSGLRKLGVSITEQNGILYCRGSLVGAPVHLDYPSVGATENLLMAAVLAEGETTVSNAAREPEIVDLCHMLRKMGAKIAGEGSGTLHIRGVPSLHAVEYRPIPDRIVAGTLLIAAAVTGGDVLVRDACPDHMRAVLAKLRETGALVREGTDGIRITMAGRPRSLRRLDTYPYPGFPTDLQAPMMTLLTVAEGSCGIWENVFENRLTHASELRRMGADIEVFGSMALVRGVPRLRGARVFGRDLRAGAALALAALNAEGESVVENAGMIDRGYADLPAILGSLGAEIRREHHSGEDRGADEPQD